VGPVISILYHLRPVRRRLFAILWVVSRCSYELEREYLDLVELTYLLEDTYSRSENLPLWDRDM
jgi:hypothetical protein